MKWPTICTKESRNSIFAWPHSGQNLCVTWAPQFRQLVSVRYFVWLIGQGEAEGKGNGFRQIKKQPSGKMQPKRLTLVYIFARPHVMFLLRRPTAAAGQKNQARNDPRVLHVKTFSWLDKNEE